MPRLFVAAYPPPDIAATMLNALAALKLTIRATPPEQVHLTLQFIGDTDARDLEAIRESVKRSASGLATAARLSVTSLITLPPRGQPRLVAAALEPHSTLLELHRRLALRLARNAKDHDRFLPHMTLGRYPSSGGPRIEHPSPKLSFDIASITLVESILRPDHAEHRTLLSIPLGE